MLTPKQVLAQYHAIGFESFDNNLASSGAGGETFGSGERRAADMRYSIARATAVRKDKGTLIASPNELKVSEPKAV